MKHVMRLLPLVMVAALPFIGGCASTEDEAEADRRTKMLEEDNAALRKRLEDLAAVEQALNRELESKKRELEDARGRARENEERARALQAEKRRLAEDARLAAVRASERPAVPVVDIGAIDDKNVEVVRSSEGVTVRMAGAVMFRPGRDDLTPQGRRILDRVIGVLKSRLDLLISVEGHTDATPLGKTKKLWGTNLALSLARAMSVHEYLKRNGISESRMRVVGWGEHRPLVPGTGKAANARNRRVELILRPLEG